MLVAVLLMIIGVLLAIPCGIGFLFGGLSGEAKNLVLPLLLAAVAVGCVGSGIAMVVKALL